MGVIRYKIPNDPLVFSGLTNLFLKNFLAITGIYWGTP